MSRGLEKLVEIGSDSIGPGASVLEHVPEPLRPLYQLKDGFYAFESALLVRSHEWQQRNGTLRRGTRLVPKQPFVLGGALSLDNLRALDEVTGMRFRAAIAVQIRDLPDGALVTLEVTE